MIFLDKTIKLQYILIIQHILIIRKPLMLMTYSTSPRESLIFEGFLFLTICLMVGNNKLYRPNPNEFVSYRISKKRMVFLDQVYIQREGRYKR